MATPSWQIAANWTTNSLVSSEWVLLREQCFLAVSEKWTGKSASEISDYVDEGLDFIAEILRTEIAEAAIDGAMPRFEIDNEPSPYLRAKEGHSTALLNKLRRICPFAVEQICADILNHLGASSYITQRSGDGGIDFIGANLNIVPAALSVPLACKATVIGQTKRYKENNIITETMLREFVGAGVLKKHHLRKDGGITPLGPTVLAFWTTSSFEPNAKIYARAIGLWYMDGNTLAAYIETLGISAKVMAMADAS